MKSSALVLLVCFTIQAAVAQPGSKILLLTKKSNPSKIFIIKTGHRVTYTFSGTENKKVKGIVTGINDHSIFINRTEYPLDNFSRIIRRKKGHALGIILIPVGLLYLILDPVPADAGLSAEFFVPELVILSSGIALTALTRKSFRSSTWDLKVVEN